MDAPAAASSVRREVAISQVGTELSGLIRLLLPSLAVLVSPFRRCAVDGVSGRGVLESPVRLSPSGIESVCVPRLFGCHLYLQGEPGSIDIGRKRTRGARGDSIL